MKRIGAMAATAMIALLLALPLGLAMAQDGDTGPRPPATLFGHGNGRRFCGSYGDHDRGHGW